MIEVTKNASAKELFGRMSLFYEQKSAGRFVGISEDFESLRQKTELLGLEISKLKVADLETVLLIQRPGAKIGEQELVVHNLNDGTLWLEENQQDSYWKLIAN
ncbi:MAG TPA: hypothetical protein VIK81_00135 [Patescibacteria group bacterium]